jgi:hypothetical protein
VIGANGNQPDEDDLSLAELVSPVCTIDRTLGALIISDEAMKAITLLAAGVAGVADMAGYLPVAIMMGEVTGILRAIRGGSLPLTPDIRDTLRQRLGDVLQAITRQQEAG